MQQRQQKELQQLVDQFQQKSNAGKLNVNSKAYADLRQQFQDAKAAIRVRHAQEWTALQAAATKAPQVTAPVEEYVTVYHASVNDGKTILEHGFDSQRGTVFVSRDRAAAEDALRNHPDASGKGVIIESKIPKSDFDRLFEPAERPYGGFFDNLSRRGGLTDIGPDGQPVPKSSEIVLKNPEQIKLLNKNLVKQPVQLSGGYVPRSSSTYDGESLLNQYGGEQHGQSVSRGQSYAPIHVYEA
ncbi:MAG: hypothetical protein NTY53_17260, partial [Kiritimatiellaeota bacterium]|nr:hypothetical protein [Kiritimatiellota bacterium]